MVARFLITTADERTWKFDKPVLFLGEWCRVYDKKHIWENLDAVVAPPYGLSQAKKDEDHAAARALEEKIFPDICSALNNHHGIQQSQRFWLIVLGHWLRRYVDVILNRFNTLKQCIESYEISGTTIDDNDKYCLATKDSNTWIWALNDDRWNSALTARILPSIISEGILVENISSDSRERFELRAAKPTGSFIKRLMRWGYRQTGSVASYFVKDSDIFIISSYLPKLEAVKLQLTLGQFPQLWTQVEFQENQKPDQVLRKILTKQLLRESDDKLEQLLRALFFEQIPLCYLESFSKINELTEKLPWPKKPRLVFTSNAFDTDEVFKIYLAKNVSNGTRYIAGQHGANYGTHRHWLSNTGEEVLSDKFLTWGWTDGLSQHVPAFIFKTVGQKRNCYDPNGGLLLIELLLNHRITTWDGTAEFCNYFMEQLQFARSLECSIKKQLTIRLPGACSQLKWNEPMRWQDFDPGLKIDSGQIPINKLIAKCRLVVHSYDSTGILETLSSNIPTIAFWQDGFDHLRESSKPYYQLLVDAEIIHLSVDSAAHKVNMIWDDVQGWWNESKVQNARREFCDRYSCIDENPRSKLSQLLLDAL